MKLFGRLYTCIRLTAVLVLPGAAFSQAAATDSAIRAAGLANAVSQFREHMGTALPLYSGPRYTYYYAQMKEGHPFFRSPMPHRGEVMFDNIFYPNLYLKYDMLMNKVVLTDSAHQVNTTLNNDKIDYFNIDKETFVKLYKTKNNGLPETDFYQVLFEGKNVTLYKKDQRKINEDSEHKRYIWADVSYYLKKGDTYYPVGTQGKALNAMDDKRAQLRSYIRSQNLSFREDVEDAVKATVSYYDSLLK
ncbi:hypothetical protein GWC95_16625 [Sediminibacterium roseum]|uniref:DKNYY family protein n=1 Tax=Sediminibacterium roseum TaxID=1978412 RepID=A0ABW9ZWM7_9BACT|nr:hypothetical protein [Sediminibacterium roseum]NCI51556.1 hypothetical protein [Sediminibacterium roseum]